MDISARTDYAVRAMLLLAQSQRDDDALVSVEELSAKQSMPRKFMEAIIADLKKAGLVLSVRGARGGYRLAMPADQITIGAIFRCVDGPLAEVRGLRPHETSYDGVAAGLPAVWVAVRSALRSVLDETTLVHVLDQTLPEHVQALVDQPDAWRNR